MNGGVHIGSLILIEKVFVKWSDCVLLGFHRQLQIIIFWGGGGVWKGKICDSIYLEKHDTVV